MVLINQAIRDFECNGTIPSIPGTGQTECYYNTNGVDFPRNFCGDHPGPQYRNLELTFNGGLCKILSPPGTNICGARIWIPDPSNTSIGGVNIVVSMDYLITAQMHDFKWCVRRC
jgi:hypothetical protein